MSDLDRWTFEAIGTLWSIETTASLDVAVRHEVRARIDRFDRDWSRFRPDSLVSALAAGAAHVPEPVDADALFAVYDALSQATDGAVNPLVGDALAGRGYDAGVSLRDTGPTPAPARWHEIVRRGDGELSLAHPATIDVGAAGKGRLVDLVLDLVLPHAGTEAIVDASGDLAVRGGAQRIGLEHPFDPSRAIGVIEIRDAALCASATNRRAWGEGLHHVLDARTGEPVRAVAATWAVADSAMRADAIATALFFEGGAALAHAWGVEWVRMTTDGRVEWSPGSTAELFT